MMNTSTADQDVRDFAMTLRDMCRASPVKDCWQPDEPADDRDPHFRQVLLEAGWLDVSESEDSDKFVGVGAIELGRALVSVDCIDAMLGHGVAIATGFHGNVLARYRKTGDVVWLFDDNSCELGEIVSSVPVSHLDALAVSLVETAPLDPGLIPAAAINAWIGGMTGYLAGLSLGATELSMNHAVGRAAFGKPLSNIEAVSIKLADSVTTSEGLQMVAAQLPTVDVLRYASGSLAQVMKDSHQILGALGFTREFPLQRFSRRAAALAAWNAKMMGGMSTMLGEQS